MTKELDSEEVGFFDPEYEGNGAVANAGKMFSIETYVLWNVSRTWNRLKVNKS